MTENKEEKRCDKYIDAERIVFKPVEITIKGITYTAPTYLFALKEDIDAMPAADVSPVRHAHWIENEDYSLTCSACGHTTDETVREAIGDGIYDGVYDIYDPYFCAKCGARMDEEATK